MKTSANILCKRIVVLDTSAFLAGFDPFSLSEEQVTVPKVEEEIRKNSMILVRFKTSLESGKLKIKTPKEDFLNQVKASARKVGDSFKLSETDIAAFGFSFTVENRRFCTSNCN